MAKELHYIIHYEQKRRSSWVGWEFDKKVEYVYSDEELKDYIEIMKSDESITFAFYENVGTKSIHHFIGIDLKD